ncbi:chemotaxis protein CheW [Haladaptatus halobius]|uniref:chemotaxis protein CheW n=1 Tax=Haladaptatus halobius TaxID=2884875 RepID=UPI002105E173|nr:chemotaxis protein CheW [Haladaptatus halobius]
MDSIVEVKKGTRIPRTPDSIEGVMDLRGETTAIIDPKKFLSVASATSVTPVAASSTASAISSSAMRALPISSPAS